LLRRDWVNFKIQFRRSRLLCCNIYQSSRLAYL
jgi:hypothetical protein